MKNRKVTTILGICLLTFALVGCGKKEGPTYVTPATADVAEATLSKDAQTLYQYSWPEEGDLCADVEILDYGHIYIKLFKEDAEYAVDNFVQKAENGDYDGTLVSEAVNDYYVQAGAPLSDATKEESIWGGGFSNEISEKLFTTRGAVCMANQGTDGTNAMQFFFVTTEVSTINGLERPLTEHYGMSLEDYLASNYAVSLTDAQLQRFLTYGGAPWLYGHNTVFGQVFSGYDVMDQIEAAVLNGDEKLYVKKIVIYEYVD